jgi:hypothetical protein
VFNEIEPPPVYPVYGDAVSREFTVYSGNQPLRVQFDCVSREFTVSVFDSGPGDLNCDGQVNFLDVPAFVLALIDPPAYYATYFWCDIYFADLDANSVIDGRDIQGFVDRLLVGP